MAARFKSQPTGGAEDENRNHYGPYESLSYKDEAPCSYRFQKRLRGFDRSVTWDMDAPRPVTCVDCLLKRPAKWKVRKWNSVGFYGKKRRF